MSNVLLGLALLTAPDDVVRGFASGYAPGVFEDVVTHRHAMDWWRNEPPMDWYVVAGYAATNDCSQVGQVVQMRPAGAARWSRVLVADCAGNDGTPQWMHANRIVAELDYGLWARWTAAYGRPLALEMRP